MFRDKEKIASSKVARGHWALKSCSWGKNSAAPCVPLQNFGSRQKF